MSKNIVICCDGTGNEYSHENTNIVKLFQIIEKNTSHQLAFYDPGVGAFKQKILTKTFGIGLREGVERAYRYLMNTYEEGDKVYFFGFSRGAFIMRSLSGLLAKCGLLYKYSANMVPYAAKIYYAPSSHNLCAGFKETFCRPCDIHFLGIWDTVGFLKHIDFYSNQLSKNVHYAFHALAIDELRTGFQPYILDTQIESHQVLEQVWFPGSHADVGGGYIETGLSDISLRWMIDKATRYGLKVRAEYNLLVQPDPLATFHLSRIGLWRLLPSRKRSIHKGAMIHNSILVRKQHYPAYDPNLPITYEIAL
jgi:uncharacterized protein (DUF2235 family)